MLPTVRAWHRLFGRIPLAILSLQQSVPQDTLALTDQGVRAVSSLRALTYRDLSRCRQMTDEGLRAVIK